MDWISSQLDGIISGVVLMWIFAGVIHSLPAPTKNSGNAYLFLYKFMHFIGANFDKMKAGKLPSQEPPRF